MKRKLLWGTAAFLAAVSSIAAISLHLSGQAKLRRAAANRLVIESALLRFSEKVPLGATRKQVKEVFRTRAISFQERCCFEPNGPFSILVQVGKEDKPWYCSEWPDYVAFEFSATATPHRVFEILESDVLKLVHLTSNGEGCL
uniref:Uncharacterized protein n=1 Tax=Solibacter usitatus (strain Ellin6076) TaxID=234267 RepID=Q029G8_SOLUE